MNATPLLLPMPRRMTLHDGTMTLPENALIVIDDPARLFEAQRVQAALGEFKVHGSIAVGAVSTNPGGIAYADPVITLTLDPNLPQPQGYALHITAQRVEVRGADAAGVFYGVCTLCQLVQQYGASLPLLLIEDYPDFPVRGVMLDISRDRVPTMPTLYALIDLLAGWKLNQLQLYIEHTFAYQRHQRVWQHASPLTAEEILLLDAYCRQRHIDLVPHQNSPGHMERWLQHPEYLALAESPDGFIRLDGDFSPPTTLNPTDPAAVEFVSELYAEFLPNFTSPLVNIGGDETWELGQGKSKPMFEARGLHVYLDYLLQIREVAARYGRQVMFWDDILIDAPELLPDVPRDMIALEWGYESNHKFEARCGLLAQAGITFYVCPGTSSWNAITGRVSNMRANIDVAVTNGQKHGAAGCLLTDWGDRGHWQALPFSYPGFAYGAAAFWCHDTAQTLDLPAVLNTFVFKDQTGVTGQVICEMGNIYRLTGPENINGQPLAYLLQARMQDFPKMIERYEGWGGEQCRLDPTTLNTVIERLTALSIQLNDHQMQVEEAHLIGAEIQHAAALLIYSAHRLLWWQGVRERSAESLVMERAHLIEQQRALWLQRSRPGGLEDSLARFALATEGTSEDVTEL